MPEHVHLLVYPGDAPERMSDFLRAVKEPVARKAIRHLKSNAPAWLARVTVREGARVRRRFWQPGGGYDRNITSIEALRAMIEYIHANPVRRGLVARAEDWEWCSARWYARLRPVKLEMDPEVLTELARG
jgi:putative transposase